ncbi:amidohydrolase family protein [Rothia aerolata]|uniref:Amidohydrolase (Aminocarboxymuconate-semialdehyde decarboxylase) n=1 Tax=Rothia aerolata TaxID=1812262 RepID=A0A917MWS9_9MICC|nr:amidohydrolase family protein [Rothia aerolata]GGH65417.1 putative amidohydrolase (aminocarboxymuconate-semialdehyde decarboxylase) [Rothia aerolata]
MKTQAIDTHAHIYPSWYLDELERIGVNPETAKIARIPGADSTETDLADRFEWMTKAGVARQVLAVTPQIPSGNHAEGSLRAAQMINDHYAELVATYPDKFSAYGALPLPFIEESLSEIARIFDELHFRGVSITTVLPTGVGLDDPLFDPVWEELNRRGAVVNIHPTGSGAYSPLITNSRLEWVNGAPVEDGVAVLHLLKAAVPERFPKITFHLAHLGGDILFMFQRLEDNFTDWGAFESSPQKNIRSMYFDAANFYEPSLRLAVEAVGASQIMGGSDHPYFQHSHYERAFDYIRSARLQEEEKQAILSENAVRLLGLPEPDSRGEGK